MAASRFTNGCVLAAVGVFFAALAHAQSVADYPSKPIRALVAQEAGVMLQQDGFKLLQEQMPQ